MKKTLENLRDCEAWRYFLRGYRGKKEILAGVFKADWDPRERERMCYAAHVDEQGS